MRIAFASREVYPFGGGGIGQFVASAATVLSRVAEVTIITTSLFEETYERMRAANDPRLPGPGVRFGFVPEPSEEEVGGWYHIMHCYGGRLLDTLRELFPDGGPDLVEFPDFLGEAFVPLQAAHARDPFLSDSRICVRMHTTAEMCEVLDGYVKRDDGSRAVHAMERYCLGHADHVIWQGGDILGTYERFYGSHALAATTCIRYPYAGPWAEEGADGAYEPSTPLKLLYTGRFERRKGVQNLVQALTSMERDDVHLTMVGADTPTAPLGVSMRGQLELAIADDPRITLEDPVDRTGLADAIRAHDVVVIPSLWECWPYAALEPMHLNRPVLGTPVGGLVEMLAGGEAGWLSRGTDPIALEDALERLLGSREEVIRMIRQGGPSMRAHALSAAEDVVEGYQRLLDAPLPRRARQPRPVSRPPLDSAIVPYYRAARFVRDAIDSLLAQSYPRLEIVLVNDGSFEDEDWLVAEIAGRLPVVVVSQMNRGLGAARNFGISQSRGRYVFPLDADNTVEPDFVARAVDILEHNPEAAYVTSWSYYVDVGGRRRTEGAIGYQPLGNHAALNADDNVSGDAVAVLRRRIFDSGFRYSEELTSFEDWHLYRELQRANHFGVVIPERLMNYRVRTDSMQAEFAQPRRDRLVGEINALMRENEVRWTSSNA